MKNEYHKSVLLKDCIELLNIRRDGIYVDLTFGGGGHSKAILSELGAEGRLFAFDQDEDAARNVIGDPRFTLIPHNFRYMRNYLRLYGVREVNGILGDLGVSSHQFDEAERGFSIRSDAKLDMRMNRRNPLTAARILNEYDPKKLGEIFRDYGELREANRIAKLIAHQRVTQPVESTFQLIQILQPVMPRQESNKFLARVFQALRIEVNDEIGALKECLAQCTGLLGKNGRLVIISYQSLEDRLVKNLIRSGNTEGIAERDQIYGTERKIFKNLTGKPRTPNETEMENNPRSRSARLRAAEKTD
jgi:16S rRNA (cytosine1402-N4)-methyltransferase